MEFKKKIIYPLKVHKNSILNHPLIIGKLLIQHGKLIEDLEFGAVIFRGKGQDLEPISNKDLFNFLSILPEIISF